MTTRANPRFQWNAWTIAPLVLALTAVAPPYLLRSADPVAVVLHGGFALVCHQQPERCFWLFGAPVAVCARCLGIYLGAAVGLLLRTSRRLALQLLIMTAALNLFDVLTEHLGVHDNWLGVRFALGLAMGAAGAILISSSIEERSTELLKTS